MQTQLKALGVKPAVSGGEPAPTPPSPPPGPEGEPQPASYPPQTGAAVPPPTAFYPGNGMTPPPQVSYQSVPVPNQIQRKTFSYDKGKKRSHCRTFRRGASQKYAYRGADANASVTGNESTVPMQLRITGRVEMPNSKTYDLTGCFVGLEARAMSPANAPLSVPAISAVSKVIKPSISPLTATFPLWGKTGLRERW